MQELTAGQPAESGAALTPTTLAELDARISKAAADLPAVLREGRDRYNRHAEAKNQRQSARGKAQAAQKQQAKAAASSASSANAAKTRAAAALKRPAEAAASSAPSANAAKGKAAASKRRAVAAGAAIASATAEACSAEPAQPQSGSWSFFGQSRRACLAALLGVGVSLPSPPAAVQAFLERLWILTSGSDIGEAAAVAAAEATLAQWENRETDSAPDG